jgi:hypothetical protein
MAQTAGKPRIQTAADNSAYKEDAETHKIELFSEDYFKLVRTHPELAKCFALGERVVVVIDNIAYETIVPLPEPRPKSLP